MDQERDSLRLKLGDAAEGYASLPLLSHNIYTLTPSLACSIWCVELIRREIMKQHPDTHLNAILIDFFLYDTIKSMEASGQETVPHHRTRSIWY